MRLGKKKEKDRDQEKEQLVDGVARLICSPNPKQSHPIPLRGSLLVLLNLYYMSNAQYYGIYEISKIYLQFILMERNGLV